MGSQRKQVNGLRMKSVIISSFIGLGVHAGISEMKRDFNSLKVAAAINKSNDSSLTAGELRSISSTFGPVFESFNGYGCWCYFEDEHGHGRGQAVDEVDQCCHDLANGYDCAIMDSNNACIPWEVDYVSGIGGGPDSIVSRCEEFNIFSECAQIACKIEGLFVQRMFDLIIANTGVNSDYHNSNFDAASECVTIVGGGPADKECCGVHPMRKPFHTRGGANACCADTSVNAKIYNTLSHDCCDDEEVRDICM